MPYAPSTRLEALAATSKDRGNVGTLDERWDGENPWLS